jgi:hypothetical protein
MGENMLGKIHPNAKGINTVRIIGMWMEIIY